jgi:hypothetical protein
MTSITEQDYEHANTRGNGPRNRMEGGDLTDDIEINDPDSPLKKKLKKEVVEPVTVLEYKKPE